MTVNVRGRENARAVSTPGLLKATDAGPLLLFLSLPPNYLLPPRVSSYLHRVHISDSASMAPRHKDKKGKGEYMSGLTA